MTREVGLTRDVGWEIGVSRSFPCTADDAWAVLTAGAGLAMWLGELDRLPEAKGEPYRTAAGTTGEIRSYRPGDRIRLTWQPAGRDRPATVQVALSERATARGPSTTVRFHAEHLADAEERESLRGHWTEVLDALDPLFARAT